ncbi:phospholipase effector Tle1 domain-containing protein [Pseudomonas frederiksbergensis]|uniref:phospholipase effector Tle1 domain-containing protein n=1 Tax=Pseudomonas frederiksbergensis TaxID=104087 RepID=UPI003D00DD92
MTIANLPSSFIKTLNLLLVSSVILILTACASSQKKSESPQNTLATTTFERAEFIPVVGFSTCLLQSDDVSLIREIQQGRMIPDTRISFEGGRNALSVSEMNQWSSSLSALENGPIPLVIDPLDSRPVFVAVFDGTWNDREDSNIPITVPGMLSRELEASQAKTPGLQVKYYNGVGTRVSMLRHWWEGATGAGTKERAEQAFVDLQAFTQRERKLPHIYAIGFSRGAASARHFLNLTEPMLRTTSIGTFYNRARSFTLLFDTVGTGQIGSLQLGIPPSTSSAVQFVATHERRLSFPVVPLLSSASDRTPGQRIVELTLPAAHSDLGGGYGEGLEALSLVMARNLLVRQGFILPEQSVEQQAMLNLGWHNSDWPGTAIGNALRGLGGAIDRQRIEPKSSASPGPVEEPFIAQLENAMREVAASKAELERVQEHYRDKPAVFDGLSVQLLSQNNGLVVSTNCPKNVKYDRRSRWFLLNGQPYVRLTEQNVSDTEAGRGIILIVPRQNPNLFTSKITN